mgnify:CR=1 FL=1
MCIYSLDNGAGDWVRNRADERVKNSIKFKGTECRIKSDKTCKMVTSGWQLSKRGQKQVQHITNVHL